jgi:DNA-binding NtrC family response regulator
MAPISRADRWSSSNIPEVAAEGPRDFSTSGEKSPAARRVLIVDDEPLIRWSLEQTFGDRGFESVVAANAIQAIDASMAPAPFDAVLLDFRLPDSNDLTLLARLRGALPQARIILMTAYATDELAARALELGAYRVINKPFEMNDLAALVTAADSQRD